MNQNNSKWWSELSEMWQHIFLMNYAINKKYKELNHINNTAFIELPNQYELNFKQKFQFSNFEINENLIDEISQLTRISCNGFPVSDLKPLYGFNLLQLSITNTDIQDLKTTNVFNNLEFLSFGKSKIYDISHLSSLPKLKHLVINNALVYDSITSGFPHRIGGFMVHRMFYKKFESFK